ncbi:MAG: flavodoxin family protein [Dehalococcoidia bacterium]|nr:flavodoxin family protein [Dehalococcoidia bacterium]
MKVLGFNGSPRKNWNTATLLRKALEGAASQGAETEFVHLNDLRYRGCQSCFGCKTIGGKSYGSCATRDDLTPFLERVKTADAIVMGSPVYLGAVTGGMRSFLERLIFPYLVYDAKSTTIFPRKIKTGFIYTMNMTEDTLKGGRFGFDHQIAATDQFLKRIFGVSEWMASTDTYQFEDYSRIYAPRFDPTTKARRRQEVFPLDCQKAFEMGARLAGLDSG